MKRILLVMLSALVLALAGCATKEGTGTAVGAGAGAVIGSQVGDNEGVGALIGAVAGGLLGREVGQWMDQRDRQQVAETLEEEPTGETTAWVNPDTGRRFQITPTATFERDGQPCRRFSMDIEGKAEDITGTACRTQDGSWQVVESAEADQGLG